MIRAGRLKDRCAILHDTATGRSTSGQPVETLEVFAERWADRQDLRGKTLFEAQQRSPEISTKFTVRFIEGLNHDMKVRDEQGRVYDIEAISDLDQKEGHEIMASRRPS